MSEIIHCEQYLCIYEENKVCRIEYTYINKIGMCGAYTPVTYDKNNLYAKKHIQREAILHKDKVKGYKNK